jgi:hypothetical protein
LLIRESDLLQKSFYVVAQELVYQWLGAWATPYWYNDYHINKAIAGKITI